MSEIDVPEGWSLTTVGEIAEVRGGLTRNADQRAGATIRVPLVTVGSVGWREIRPEDFGEIGLIASDGDRATLQHGDLLVVEGNGSLSQIGRVAMWMDEASDARHQNHLIRLRAGNSVDARFLLEWLASPLGRAQLMDAAASATGLFTLSISKIAALEIVHPPIAHQRRIVAHLDDLLARARRAREVLADVPALLDQLRQSVLAAAFRGDLTAEWREAHPDVEPAAVLLERIRAERRRRFEEANPKKKYEPPAPVNAEAEGLSELPAGWEWATLDELLHELRNGISAKPSEQLGLPILRISAVRPLEVNMQDTRFLPVDFPGDNYLLSDGDLLFTRYNGNADLVGACGVVRCVDGRIVYPDKLIRGRLIQTQPEFLAQMMATNPVREQVRRASKTAAGQVGISGRDLKAVRVPLAPLAEQVEVARRVRVNMDTVRAVEAEVADMRGDIEALERATLAKAFRGELSGSTEADVGYGRLTTARAAGAHDRLAP